MDDKPLLVKEPKCWEYAMYNTKTQIFLVLILCAFIGLGTPFIWQAVWRIQIDCCAIESDLRYNCYPQLPYSQQNKSGCDRQSAQCCWDKDATDDQIKCYYRTVTRDRNEKMPRYKVEIADTNRVEMFLDMDSVPDFLQEKREPKLANMADKLTMTVVHYAHNYFSVKIASNSPPPNEFTTDSLHDTLHYKPMPAVSDESTANYLANVSWTTKTDEDFSLTITRKKTGTNIFHVGSYAPFVFSDRYIELTTLLPNDLLFGLGQEPSSAFKRNLSYPDEWLVFNQQPPNVTVNQSSWFGAHPFYLGLEGDGNAYGVLLLNSYPMQIVTNSRPSLTFRLFGGDLNFHFFLGPTPGEVVGQLYKFLYGDDGIPMPPYWSLGFHLCRATCDDRISDAKKILNRMAEEGVPVESDCGNSLESRVSFNMRKSADDFEDMKIFHKFLTERNMSVTVALIPQIWNQSRALTANLWRNHVLTSGGKEHTGLFYHGQCSVATNESVVYPNYFDDYSDTIVRHELDMFSPSRIDGVILNYNTPLDLSGNGSCATNPWSVYYEMNAYTPCAETAFLIKSKNYSHLSVHNLYGYMHMKRMKNQLYLKDKSTNRRKLVVSLSTFTGSGYYGGHWGGPLTATWDMLRQTVFQTLQFNMFGVPLTGFPVCGYTGKANDSQLCLSWYRVAAFQPFMISNRDFDEPLTDPISITMADTQALDTIKKAIVMRYRLLPYFYTQFYRSRLYHEMPVRPLFVEWPTDRRTYRIDRQYLWGRALMVSPATEYDQKSVRAYFPAGNWYDFYSGGLVPKVDGPNYQNLSAVEGHTNLHIRGGFVIPTQFSGNNTVESRLNPFTLTIALDSDRKASGELYIDDGITDNPVYSSEHMLIRISAEYRNNQTIEIVNDAPLDDSKTVRWSPDRHTSTIVDTISVYGLVKEPKGGVEVRSYRRADDSEPFKEPEIARKCYYNSHSGVFTVKELNIDLTDERHFLSWTYKTFDEIL